MQAHRTVLLQRNSSCLTIAIGRSKIAYHVIFSRNQPLNIQKVAVDHFCRLVDKKYRIKIPEFEDMFP